MVELVLGHMVNSLRIKVYYNEVSPNQNAAQCLRGK